MINYDEEYQYLMTYVFNKELNKWFFVSTKNRWCSSDYPMLFSETITWEWIKEENKRGKIIGEMASVRGSDIAHIRAINNLLTHGEPEIEEGEDE